MAKHKKHEEHVDESWLVPYSDMLTLLMALFLVLYAMSTVDAGKFKAMALSLNKEFKGGTGKQEFLSVTPPKTKQDLTEEKVKKLEKEIQQYKSEHNKNAAKQAEMEKLEKIKQKIDEYIKKNNLNLNLKTSLDDRGLLITILDKALFDSGKATVKPESLNLGKEISKLLVMDKPRQIMVSGHTDNLPIHNQEFKSNWELSTARSVHFLQVLLDNKDINPNRMSALGYGEYKPVSDNNSSNGRSQNRRVEVQILPMVEELK